VIIGKASKNTWEMLLTKETKERVEFTVYEKPTICRTVWY
jgi:hypothetical protein